jgi:2'-5' RNA ligase
MMKAKNYLVPVFFLVLSLISFLLANRTPGYLFTEVYARFGRNILFVLALILPILCGMGINFAIIVGAISTQIVVVIAIDLGLSGMQGFLFVSSFSVLLAVLLGSLIAELLNRTKGKEMIVSIVIGLLASSLYQFLFMVVYGLVIQPRTPGILLDRGIGVRSTLNAGFLSEFVNSLFPFTVDQKVLSLFPLLIAFLGILVMFYLPGITRAMKQAAANHTAFTATVDSIGIFSKKRILWAHVAPDNTLETLHADLANELNRPETRFASHITLVRKAKVEKAPLPPLPKTGFPVRELTLFESSSSPDGVVYTELAKMPLRTNSKA